MWDINGWFVDSFHVFLLGMCRFGRSSMLLLCIAPLTPMMMVM